MKPLQGIKVVELGTHVAVPTAARLLADWGAEVIKVEAITGDLWRYYGLNTRTPITEEENPIFCVPNSNKEIISLNLKSEEGLDILMRLLGDADVFLSNVRMSGLKRMGLDYETLSRKFPQLVYFHFTGYGHEGPWASRPGFDIAAFWAAGGELADWPSEGDQPFAPSAAFGDMTVSSMVASGVLAGVVGRLTSGKGCYLTTSLYATSLWYGFGDLISTQPQYGMKRPYPKSNVRGNPFLGAYLCGDGNSVYLAALEYDRNYAKCIRALGLDEYLDDPRFSTLKAYSKHAEEFCKLCSETFLTRSADEWEARFGAEDVVIQKLAHAADLHKSEQAWAAGMLNRVDFPTSGNSTVFPNSPVKFIGEDNAVTGAVGGIGCHTAQVLNKLGLSEEEIRDLAQRRIVRMPE